MAEGVPYQGIRLVHDVNPTQPAWVQHPRFQGSEQGSAFDSFLEWFKANISYRKIADNRGVAVAGEVKFIVGPYGDITSVEVEDEIPKKIAAEIKRTVMSSPPWTSGINEHGRTSRYQYTFLLNYTPGSAATVTAVIDALPVGLQYPRFQSSEPESSGAKFFEWLTANTSLREIADQLDVAWAAKVTFIVSRTKSIYGVEIDGNVPKKIADVIEHTVRSSERFWTPAIDENGIKINSRYAVRLNYTPE